MARNKYPEETVKKILNVSEQLFLEKGYDHTTIQDIVDNLGGLTKGVIYHHFKSKEEIFNTILEKRYAIGVTSQIESMKGISGFEKIRKINSMSLQALEHQKIAFSAKSLITNPRIIGELYAEAFTNIIPYIKTLVEEGIEDGSIKTDYPQEIAELIVLSTNIWLAPSLYEMNENDLLNKLHFFKMLYEGVNFPLIDEEYIKDAMTMFRAIQK
ncbi:TetR/AcrR family transcriptional regulator [Candidatus Enterococcus ikei]|uniref:TetR/AcrR family transcriptional regulator n=1 Tax=Candidatus Enterococcus ikei TaxID=2815326 RepID=A0ABS3H029_9ENTE|nr:TetR/AcrR family transcriptional regulator [Enterococcus sp. DIV0869a]MBO0440450.1 TetR/AcrR family transcriptional regulator [Enterococcus sp. DIV0869a]